MKSEVVETLCRLAVATNRELDERTIQVYVEALSGFEAQRVVLALRNLMLTATFFPSVGEIVREIRGDETIRAAQAWELAVSIAARGRYVDRDKIAPAEVRYAVRLIGGWDVIGLTDLDKLPFVMRRFCDLYPGVEAKSEVGLLEQPLDYPSLRLVGGTGLRKIGAAK